MFSQNSDSIEKALALKESYDDFILSRQSLLFSEGMIRIYHSTLGKFVIWLAKEGLTHPKEITAKHVRAFLVKIREERNLSDSYIHQHARAIKTYMRFLFQEEYTPKLITFEMPPVRQKKLPVLNADSLKVILDACKTKRDRALIMFMVDTGLRRAEVCALNWGDIDIRAGVVVVRKGKWNKPRTVVIGVNSRRALLAYKREVNDTSATSPLWQTKNGKRLSPMGLRSFIVRLKNITGINISPHALRRTFATLSLRAGMNPLHLQSLLGHSTLEMTRQYIEMLEDDLIIAHNNYGPIDKFIK